MKHSLELVRIVIEFPCESLKHGQSVKIEEVKQDELISGNYVDLYDTSSEEKIVHLKLANKSIERAKTISIQKGNLAIILTADYDREQKHHLDNNQFSKSDHLKSKSIFLSFEVFLL